MELNENETHSSGDDMLPIYFHKKVKPADVPRNDDDDSDYGDGDGEIMVMMMALGGVRKTRSVTPSRSVVDFHQSLAINHEDTNDFQSDN